VFVFAFYNCTWLTKQTNVVGFDVAMMMQFRRLEIKLINNFSFVFLFPVRNRTKQARRPGGSWAHVYVLFARQFTLARPQSRHAQGALPEDRRN